MEIIPHEKFIVEYPPKETEYKVSVIGIAVEKESQKLVVEEPPIREGIISPYSPKMISFTVPSERQVLPTYLYPS